PKAEGGRWAGGRRKVGPRPRRDTAGPVDRNPSRRITLRDDSPMGGPGRCGGVVTCVELEPGAHPDLAEVTSAVVRTRRGEHRARIAWGMGVLEQRSYGEPKARRERYRHAEGYEQLRLPDSVRAVRLGADGCVADTVEPSELKTRRS